MKQAAILLGLATAAPVLAQTESLEDPRLHTIVDSKAAGRIETDVTKLVSFGTRNTFSDTLSDTRSIAAARRWIKAELEPPAGAVNVVRYRVYWRLADSPTWDFSRWVGGGIEHTFEGITIDNYFFGVTSVSAAGHESVVVFPSTGR